MARYDVITEINKNIDEIEHIEKFNPYHDERGRFASANGYTSMTNMSGKAIITQSRISQKNVDKNIKKVRDACSNEYSAIGKEAVNIDKVKARGGCSDEDAKKCAKLADDVFEKAAKNEPQITKDIVSTVADNGGKMYGLDFRLKQPTSMAGKIASDSKDDNVSYEVAASSIKDSVRYTAIFESKDFVAGYNNVKSSLEAAGYTEERCKNFFSKYENGKSCQKAVQCVYKNKDGLFFELQFHTYQTQGAKEVNHQYYEEQRQKGTTKKRYKQLNDAMTKISSYSEVPDGVLNIKEHG